MRDQVQRGSWSAYAVKQLLRAGSCPICEAERRAGTDRLDMLLYENVNDPGVRAALRASAGWCGYHFRLAMGIAARGGYYSSIALIYADVLDAVANPIPDRARQRQPCDVCCLATRAGRSAAGQLADVLGGQALDEAFEQTGPICLTHLPLVRALPPGRGRDRLLGRTLGAVAELAGDLKDYFDRQSYDYHGEKGDRGALGRLAPLVQGSYPGATANQCRGHDARIPWYRKLLR